MKKLFLSIIGTTSFSLLFLTQICSAAPDQQIAVPNTFSANTVITSSGHNSNNSEIQTKYNAHTHTDITQFGTVTSGTWNGTAVTTQYGGTGNNWSAVIPYSVAYFTSTGSLTTLAPGTSGNVLTTKGTSVAPTWGAAGKFIQVVNTHTGAVATGTTAIPFDDTIPEKTEGDEYFTLAITPTSAASVLRIDVYITLAHSALTNMTAALFQDTTTNALAVGSTVLNATDNWQTIAFTHYMTAGTTSSTTFKVRAGSSAGATTTLNGQSAGRIYGGVYESGITISELTP